MQYEFEFEYAADEPKFKKSDLTVIGNALRC